MAPATTLSSILVARTSLSSTSTPTSIAIPQAPPAGTIYASSTTDAWSPSAIIGIVAAVVLICLSVPLIAVIARRYQKKRLCETIPYNGGSSKSSLKTGSVREDQSLKNIMVTRELQRTSQKLSEGVRTPEKAHVDEKGWSRTEVSGGGWK